MRLLDTDVCIEILRGNRRVLQRRRETLDHVAITWMSACELAYGAAKYVAMHRIEVILELGIAA